MTFVNDLFLVSILCFLKKSCQVATALEKLDIQHESIYLGRGAGTGGAGGAIAPPIFASLV